MGRLGKSAGEGVVGHRATRPSVERQALAAFLDGLLESSRFADYCPNGLQVEGRNRIQRVVTGVTASLALLRAAVAARADAVLVHHGYFWRGEDPRLVGVRRERVAVLLEHGISLFAYHLPLDAHPDLGNNAQLARVLGWRVDGRFGSQDLGCWCDLDAPVSPRALATRVGRRLGARPLALGQPRERLTRVGWCTGAAQDMLEEAIDAGCDAFVSGEVSERTTHLAREAGVLYLAAGHHATERYGVQALGDRVAAEFGVDHRFIDDPNPV
jgi:dinuclear metal center YbgI/SA1388 family protein